MKSKVVALLFFTLIIGCFNFSQAYAENRFLLLHSSNNVDSYLDSSTLSVTRDDKNCIYYDAWIKNNNKQEIQQLNVFTNQQESLDYELYHMIIAITKDKKMIQLRSITAYGKNGAMLITNTIATPKLLDISNGSLAEKLANRITEYVSKNQIEPIAISNEKYLSLNEKNFYNLFETRGYKINKIEENQGPNVYGDYYGSATTPYSFLDKVIDKEIHFGVSGQDKQHLNRVSVSFSIEGQNYNLPFEEKLKLFYVTLQALFPDWSQQKSQNWVNSSIGRMNQSNSLMFLYLHKGKEYIMISRQPIKDGEAVLYVLEISPNQPSQVNPINPYYERNNDISVYEEWNPSQNN